MFFCCECCVLSGRGLYDELITRLEESYRVCCVVVCDQEISRMRSHGPRWAGAPQEKKINKITKRSQYIYNILNTLINITRFK